MHYTRLRSFHAVATSGGFNAAADCVQHQSADTQRAGRRSRSMSTGLELFVQPRPPPRVERGRPPIARDHHAVVCRGGRSGRVSRTVERTQNRQVIDRRGRPLSRHRNARCIQPRLSRDRACRETRQLAPTCSPTSWTTRATSRCSRTSTRTIVSSPFRIAAIRSRVFVRTGSSGSRQRKSIKIAALEGEPLIIRETGSTTRRAFEQALSKARKIRPRTVMEIGSREAIREAVIRGLGISYVSEAEFVPDPSLRLIPISDAEIFTYAHVVILQKRETSRIIRAFLEVVGKTKLSTK